MSLKKHFITDELTKIMMSEMASKNDEVFVMSPDEYEKYKSFMDDMGADISYITISKVDEADSGIGAMKATDRFENNLAVKVDRGVHTRLREMIDEGIEAKNWYYQISEAVYGSLGESEGVLFLLLLASTSARTLLSRNFDEASIVYKGFKDDLEENEQLLVQFIYDDQKTTKFSFEESSTYGSLYFVRALKKHNLLYAGAKINNIKKSFKYYYENKGNINKTDSVEFFASHFDPYSKTITGIIDFDKGNVLQQSKVYNFALNLLAPEYNVMIRNKKWYFVTMDSWMMRAMYPYLDKKSQNEIMSQNAKYLYSQQKIMRFAEEFNMEPHQVQASIWVAKFKESGKGVDSFEVVLKNKLEKLGMANKALEDIYSDLGEVINQIYDDKMSKPSGLKPVDAGGGLQLGDEEADF